MKKKPSKKTVTMAQIIAVIALYISFQIFSDILALKIAIILGMSTTVGVLLYPLTFTIRDILHKTLGRKDTLRVVLWSGFLNVIMVALFQLAIWLPADTAHWALQGEFAIIFGSVWRIVLASLLAEVVGQVVDTQVYSFFVNKITRKFQWARVLSSNFVSAIVDSLIFVVVAFWGILPWSVLWSMITVQLTIKMIMTFISLPGIYLVKDKDGVEM